MKTTKYLCIAVLIKTNKNLLYNIHFLANNIQLWLNLPQTNENPLYLI